MTIIDWLKNRGIQVKNTSLVAAMHMNTSNSMIMKDWNLWEMRYCSCGLVEQSGH